MQYHCTCNKGTIRGQTGHNELYITFITKDDLCVFCGYHAISLGRFPNTKAMTEIPVHCENLYEQQMYGKENSYE